MLSERLSIRPVGSENLRNYSNAIRRACEMNRAPFKRRRKRVHLRRQLQGDLFGVAIDRSDFEIAHLTNVKWVSLRVQRFRLTLPSSAQHRAQS